MHCKFNIVLFSFWLLVTASACSETEVAQVEDEVDAGLGTDEPIAIRVGTFNVRKFFDTECDSRNCGRNNWEYEYPESEFLAKARQVAAGIQRLQSDIVLLQELESQASMDALMDELEDEGYSVTVLGETYEAASLDVAVLSRGRLIGQRSHYDKQLPRESGGSTTFSREFLEVHLEIAGHRVIVFNAHFKAKTRDDPERRLAEATAARYISESVASSYPEALVILGGDLNDTPNSRPIRALEGDGGYLRVAEELGTGAATYTFQGEPQAIDHLYLVETPGGVYIPRSAAVIRSNQRGLAGSDHAGLVAAFRLLD